MIAVDHPNRPVRTRDREQPVPVQSHFAAVGICHCQRAVTAEGQQLLLRKGRETGFLRPWSCTASVASAFGVEGPDRLRVVSPRNALRRKPAPLEFSHRSHDLF